MQNERGPLTKQGFARNITVLTRTESSTIKGLTASFHLNSNIYIEYMDEKCNKYTLQHNEVVLNMTGVAHTMDTALQMSAHKHVYAA